MKIGDSIAGGNLKFVQRFLEKHPEEIDTPNKDGKTPLHLACTVGDENIVQLLVGLGAKATVDKDGLQPVEYAVIEGHSKIVEMMASHGETVESRTVDTMRPLADRNILCMQRSYIVRGCINQIELIFQNK
eukprot:1011776_1